MSTNPHNNLEELIKTDSSLVQQPVNTWIEVFELSSEDYAIDTTIHAGAPKKFKTPAEMALKIADYFFQQDQTGRPYTMYGLARRLGFGKELMPMNRYKDYSEGFKRIIEIAQSIVLESYEEKLQEKGMGNGVQFGLMNLGGWSKNEKQEVTHKDLQISFKAQDSIESE